MVVTGGAGLLGARYVEALSHAGAHPVVADLDLERAETVAARARGASALPVEVDVTDPRSVDAMAERILKTYGRVTALVNNAAIDPKFDLAHRSGHAASFETYPLHAWSAALRVNLTGAFLCAQTLAPLILAAGGGSIVNVSSTYGLVGPDQRLYDQGGGSPPAYKPPDYSVTKSALLGFTRYLAAYYAGRPLRVNTLTLGGVENGHAEGFVHRYAERTPMGRMARPDEYSGALIFLLSDAASYMTGSNLVVDGGWTAW